MSKHHVFIKMKISIHISSLLKNGTLALLIAILVFSASSCEKDDTSGFVDIAKVTAFYARADIYITYNFSVLHRMMNDTALLHNDTAIIDSALVTRFADSTGLIRYEIDYGEQTVARDERTKSGKILVFSYPDSVPDGDWAYGILQDYTIDGLRYGGTMQYVRTGEVIGGQPQFTFDVSVECDNVDGKVLIASAKELLQTAGAAEPLKFDLLRFDVMFTTRGMYTAGYSAKNFVTETQNSWPIDFGCAKIMRPAEATITVTSDGKTQTLIESIIDTDLDGCVDKVMLKNDKNFGFPFYI
ncbi:MAG: hypothetical protein EOM83_01740 [Clostridia bacterium]|nr:hypothetical protein [Clostridia bacterium]